MSTQLEKDIFISGRHTPIRSRQGSGKGRTYKSEARSSGSRYSSQTAHSSTLHRVHKEEEENNDKYWNQQLDQHDHQESEEVLKVTDYYHHHPAHLTDMDSLARKSVTFNSNNKHPKDSSTNSHRNKDGGSGVVVHHSSQQQSSAIQTRPSSGSTMNGLLNGDAHERFREANNNNYNGQRKGSSSQRMRPKRVDETQWYTRPIHLGFSKGEVNNNHSLPTRSISPISRPDHGPTAVVVNSPLVAQKLDSSTENSDLHNNSTSKELDTTNNTSTASVDPYALRREYFPITLGAPYEANNKPLSPTENGNSSAESLSPPCKGLTGIELTPWKVSHPRAKSPGRSKRPSSGHSSTSSRSRSRKSRPSSAQSSSSSASKSSLDRMYLMSVEAPTIGSSTVLLSSPYQSELARLRMDRLRIEEEHLLEVKRQDELERIRGPQPKWYELKSPQFHYEAHKNNSLISNKDDWQALLDYRTELENASKQFQNAYSATGST